jgi:hypothetical protein
VRPGAARGGGDGRLDQVDQLAGGADRGAAARVVDEAGDPGGEALLAVDAEDAGQLGPGVGGQHLGGGDPAGGVHAHVERRVHAVAEAALRLVELQGGDAQVVEHAVHPLQAEAGGDLGQVGEGRGHRHQALPRPRQALARQRQGRGVAVQADHAAAGGAGLQDPLGVAAEPHRGVEVDAIRPWPEQLDAPVGHDREVARGGQHDQIPRPARWLALEESE